VAVASYKLSTVQVFHTSTEWTARIDEGLAGLVRIQFSPLPSCRLLTYSDYSLRITAWDLSDGTAIHVQYPKCLDWRSDGKYFALLERRDGKDAISVFDDTWTLVKHFTAPGDVAAIAWSPDGRFIAAWESSLNVLISL
jgi:WD40 repeat protein